MLRWLILPVVCVAVAAGCGGSPTGPDVDGAGTARLSRTRFLAFGDSLTAGEVTVPMGSGLVTSAGSAIHKQVLVPTASYPAVLQSQLVARYALQASAISVINAGKSSETAQIGSQRFPGVFNDSQAEVVLLMEGVNELFIVGPDFSADFVRIMVQAAQPRARVFVGSMVPSLPGRRNSQSPTELVIYNGRLQRMAGEEGAVFVDLYNPMLPDAATLIGVDGLHPTEAGYRRIAELFFAAIKADLEVR